MRETLVYRKGISPGTCLILFFAGLLAGILFVQTLDESSFAGIFSEYFLNQYASLHIEYRKLLKLCGRIPFWTVCVSGLLCGAPGGSVFYGRDSVPAGDDLGDADQYLHGPSGAEGSADLCDGSGAADLFLCTGLWMDAFVDLETGKQPEKIFVFCICRFLFF